MWPIRRTEKKSKLVFVVWTNAKNKSNEVYN